MCTIDKMLIKGVRSFSPDNTAVIEFYKPLTLIVGHNGAGKTTIIECLKMAVTGELPPNTRSGQSFIHDPKVAGETEVKAQIKLRFNTATQQPVVIIRSFQLTQTKSKMNFSTIDQVVQTFNRESGKKEALSYRCGDMQRLVPQLMGVSKAVMENVIFVHQDDSNWPLAEGKVLKAKFDDIFAATKYTKALEALSKLKKEKAALVKEFKFKLEHLKTHKENAHKLRSEVEQGSQRERKLEGEIEELEAELIGFQEEMSTLDKKMQEWSELQEAQGRLRTKLEMLVDRNARGQVQLVGEYGEEELDVELQELEAWQQELQPKIEELVARMDVVGYDIRATESRIEALKGRHASDLKAEALLSAEAESHARNVAERDRMLRAASQQAGITQLPAGTLTEEAVKGFMDAFRKQAARREEELREQKAGHQRQDDESSRLMDQVTAQMTDATQKAKIKRQTLAENESKISRLQREMEGSSISQVMVDDAEEAERVAKQRVTSKQEDLSREDFEGELSKLAAALQDLQRKASTLRHEREQLSVAADGAAKLQLLKKERNQKQTQMDTMLHNRKQALARALQCPVQDVTPPEQLKAAVERAAGELQQRLVQKSEQVRRVQSEASSSNGTLAACTAELNQQRQEADTLQNRLEASLAQINSQPLESCVASCEQRFDSKKGTLMRIKAHEISIRTFKSTAEKHNMCEVCKRPFKGNERQQFLEMQEQAAREVPGTIHQLENAVREAEGKLKALRALQPDSVRLEQLRSGVMAATTERLRQLEGQAGAKAVMASELHDEQEALQREAQEFQQLLREAVWPMDRLAGEIADLKNEIAVLENRMRASGSIRAVGAVDSELEALEGERAKNERQKDELLRRQGRLRDELNFLQNTWRDAREEVTKMRDAADKRRTLEAEIAGLQSRNLQLEHEAAEAAHSVDPLEMKREQLAGSRQQRRNAAREREAEAESRLRELQGLHMQSQDRVRGVDSYQRAGKAERLQEVRAALQATQQQLHNQEARLKEMEREQKAGDRDRALNNQNKRQIMDLIAYKRGLQEEQQCGAEIEQLQAQMGAGGDMEAVNKRFHEVQSKSHALRKEQNMKQGSLSTVKEGVLRATRDLDDVNFRNVDKRYRKQLVELMTTEMAVGDLEKYHKALEKALLTFHTTRMADINKLIKELWQRTYRNRDIDYVEIKADADMGKGAKSYNYRLVMHVGGAELEMRGRCSAGQKVLACLIIRLALAETFCLNCGILALDEPTTNLDAENSASLADALRSIMESRRAQANFQLIVITHDENFAQMIGTREHAEYMWRITKDDDQHSHLEKEQLAD